MELIAVILKSSTKDTRTAAAQTLLNYGFANYTLMDVYPSQALPPVSVLLGHSETVQPVLAQPTRILVSRSMVNQVETQLELCEDVEAPVEQGQTLGKMTVTAGDQVLAQIPIVADQAVERLSAPGIFLRLMRTLLMAG